MKIKTFSIVIIMIIIFTNALYVCAKEDDIEYFVDNSIVIKGDGSKEKPFSSIEEAKEAVRTLKNSSHYSGNKITVTIREGVYNIAKAIEFTKQDSGTKEAPIVYRSYPKENVELVGGTQINLSDCELADNTAFSNELKGKIYSYNLKKNKIDPYNKLYVTGHSQYYLWVSGLIPENPLPTPEVFYNDKTMSIARYPNNSEYMKVEKVIRGGDAICRQYQDNDPNIPKTLKDAKTMMFIPKDVTSERLSKWKNAKDAWMFGYWFYDWSDQTTAIRNIDVEKRTIESEYPSAFAVKEDQRFYIYNLIEELDVPGEWFYDKQSGEFYIYPLDTNPQGKIQLGFSSNDLITFNEASFIQIKDIGFAATRSSGISISKCEDINIFGCTVKNVSANGINVNQSKRITVDSCHIFNVGGRGINLECGDYETLEPANCLVINNWVHNFGRLNKTYYGALTLNGVGNIARNNLFYDGPHLAIQFGGNDNIIENNEVHSVMKEAADMGAIYAGRSSVKRGNIIRGNIVHDIVSDSLHTGQYGVYLDDTFCGTTVSENLFYNISDTGVFINGGRDNTVTNNIFADIGVTSVLLSAIGRAKSWGYDLDYKIKNTGLDNDLYKSEPYRKYPNLSNILEDDPTSPKYNIIKNNVNYQVGKELSISTLSDTGSEITEEQIRNMCEIKDGVVSTSNVGFVDISNQNYMLLENSKVFKTLPEFKSGDFNKAGLITSRLKHYLSDDAITLAVGKSCSYVNWNKKLIDSENLNITPIIKDEKAYIPVRFLAEMLNSEVIYQDGKIQINQNGKNLILTPNSSNAVIDGQNVDLKSDVFIMDERTYVPLRACSELFSKKVFWDDCGLIVISDEDLTKILDRDMIENLINRM